MPDVSRSGKDGNLVFNIPTSSDCFPTRRKSYPATVQELDRRYRRPTTPHAGNQNHVGNRPHKAQAYSRSIEPGFPHRSEAQNFRRRTLRLRPGPKQDDSRILSEIIATSGRQVIHRYRVEHHEWPSEKHQQSFPRLSRPAMRHYVRHDGKFAPLPHQTNSRALLHLVNGRQSIARSSGSRKIRGHAGWVSRKRALCWTRPRMTTGSQ
jgi:hypothetical protein